MKAPKVAAREAKWERARKLIAEGLTNAQIQERLGLQGYVLKQLREDAKP